MASWIRFCQNGYRNYPGTQNSIFLPDPKKDKGYFLIHKTGEIIIEPEFNSFCELKYSYIDITEGNGKVIVKNRDILPGKNFVASYVTACKHKNGNDWWIIQAENDTSLFYTFLLTNDTIILANIQDFDIHFDVWTSVGQAVFSPDGSKWVMYGDINSYNPGQGGCLVFDFDRASGELSNMQLIEIIDSASANGVAISPNSQFLYISNGYDLYQADLTVDDINSSVVHIDHWDGYADPLFGTLFGASQLAPDCKIYISCPGTNRHMHVINKPNDKGLACDFRQHAIEFPNLIYHNSITNFPHFRIDEENICDSTITWIPDEYIVKAPMVLSVSPNPASQSTNIYITSDNFEYGKIRVHDINGNVLKVLDIDSDSPLELDTSGFVPGVYVVEYVSFLSGDRDVEKLIIAE
ncbi:MAG: T9SS type A sorting domain-containing protein [Saprospiraceae bacterium]